VDNADSHKRGKSPVHRTRDSNKTDGLDSEKLQSQPEVEAAARLELEEPKRPAQRPRVTEIREAKIRARSINRQPRDNSHLGPEDQQRRSSRAKSESMAPDSKHKSKKSDSKSESKGPDSTSPDSKEVQERFCNSANEQVIVKEESNHSSSATSSDTSGKSTPNAFSPEKISKIHNGSSTCTDDKVEGKQAELLEKCSKEESEQETSPKKSSQDNATQEEGQTATDATPGQKQTTSSLAGREADVANTLLQYILSSEDPAVKAALQNIVQKSDYKVGEV